jgi:hypothetical protein
VAGRAVSGRLYAILLALVAWLLMTAPAGAWRAEMSADELEGTGDVFNLKGNVVIHRGDSSITAGSAQYDRSTGDIVAHEGFRYEDPTFTVTAESAELNLETGRGTLYDAEAILKENGFRISGKELRRVGPNKFLVRQGLATACDDIPPSWCIRGRTFDVEVGERLVARGVTFRIKDVPVMYVPYAWVPVVTERRSGLLPPTFGYRDSTGVFYRQPVFWAPSDNRDATLYLDYYSRSAFGQGLEYRYIEGPRNRGTSYLYHLRDKVRDTDFYEGRVEHRSEGSDVEGFVDINAVNSSEYFRLYEPYVERSSRRYLYSRAEVWANLDTSRLYLDSRYYQDLTEGVHNDAVIQEIPGAGLHVAPVGLGPFVAGAEARTKKFRRDLGYEGERTDGAVHASMTVGRGPTLTQEASARRVWYKVSDAGGEDEFANNQFEYRTTMKAVFTRQYESLTHAVEPAMYYSRRILDDEEAALLFDATELFNDREVAGAELVNRFIGEKGEWLTVRLSQEYDIAQDDLLDNAEPWLPARLDVSTEGALELSTSLYYDHYDQQLSRAESRIGLRAGDTRVRVGQSLVRDADIELYSLGVRQGLGRRWDVEVALRYDDDEELPSERLEQVSAAVTYRSQCWSVRVEAVRHPHDYSVYMTANLAGLGEAGTP